MLGLEAKDWHLRHVEVCPVMCELRYISSRKPGPDDYFESKHAPGFKSIDFIQSHTCVQTVPMVEALDELGEKLVLWPFEVTFCDEETMAGEKTYVFGCDSMNEQLSWEKKIKRIIDDKESMSDKRYRSYVEKIKNDEELETRRQSEDMHSSIATGLKKHVNIEVYRKARLANGKVMIVVCCCICKRNILASKKRLGNGK